MRCSAAGSRRWRGCAAQSNCGMCWTSCLPRPVLVLPWHGRPVSSCILFPALLCVKTHSMPWPFTPNRRIPHRWCIPRRVSEAAATRSLSPGDPHGTRFASIWATPKGCRSAGSIRHELSSCPTTRAHDQHLALPHSSLRIRRFPVPAQDRLRSSLICATRYDSYRQHYIMCIWFRAIKRLTSPISLSLTDGTATL